MDKEFSLTIKGFKNPEQVKCFIEWYEGQGEQDAAVWFEINEEKIGTDWMPVDVHKDYEWNKDKTNLTAWLKIDPTKKS